MLKRLAQTLLGLSLVVAPSMAAVVTFDGVGQPFGDGFHAGNPGDATFDGPLLLLGITISGDINTRELQTTNAFAVDLPLGGNYLQVNSLNDSPSTQSVVTINFDPNNNNSTWAIGNSILIDLQDTEANPSARVIVEAYNQAGVLIATTNFVPSGNVNTTPGGGPAVGTINFSLTGLDRVDFIRIIDNGGDGYLLDNLTYNLAADEGQPGGVPEPATFALMGAGLAVLGLLRRRSI